MQNIVFAGPMGVGKSSISRSLANKRKLPVYMADRLRWYYFAKHGFSDIEHTSYIEQGRKDLAERYRKRFELMAVESMMSEFSDGILDLGGGFLYFENVQQRERLQQSIKMEKRVFCLLPFEDPKASSDELKLRLQALFSQAPVESLKLIFDLNEQLIRFYMDASISMERIFVGKKSVSEITQEIEKMIYG